MLSVFSMCSACTHQVPWPLSPVFVPVKMYFNRSFFLLVKYLQPHRYEQMYFLEDAMVR